jgi:hypothetical protein
MQSSHSCIIITPVQISNIKLEKIKLPVTTIKKISASDLVYFEVAVRHLLETERGSHWWPSSLNIHARVSSMYDRFTYTVDKRFCLQLHCMQGSIDENELHAAI